MTEIFYKEFPCIGKKMKRQERAERHVTSKIKGVKDGHCINQEIYDVGTWPSGQPKQRVKYYHVTKGWKDRLLPPLLYRQSI